MSVNKIVTRVLADISNYVEGMRNAAKEQESFKKETESSNKSFQSLAQDLEREMKSVSRSVASITTGVGSQTAAWTTLGNAVGRAMGGMLMSLGPVGVAVAALGLAMHRIEGETVAFNKAIISSGQSGQLSANMLHEASRRSAEAIGVTRSAMSAAMVQVVSSGRVSVENMDRVAQAAVSMSRVSKQSVADIVSDFAALGAAPTQALLRLNEQHQFLTVSIYEQVRALEDQGRTADAAALAQKAYSDVVSSRAEELRGSLGLLETAWDGVKRMAGSAWDAMLNVGREATTQEKLEEARRLLESGVLQRRARAARIGGGPEIDPAVVVRQLEEQLAKEQQITAEKRRQNELREAELVWSRAGEELLTKQERLSREITRAWDQGVAAGKSVEEIYKRIELIQARYASSKRSDNAAERERLRLLREAEAAERARMRAEEQAIRVARQGLDTLEQRVQRLQEENEEIGLSREELTALQVARLRDAAAQNEQAAAAAAMLGLLPAEIQAYRDKAAALERIADLTETGAARRAVQESADQAAQDWQRASQQIEQDLTDALMRAFEGGASFGEAFKQTLLNMFKTMILRPVIAPIAMGMTGGFMGMMGGGPGVVPAAGAGSGGLGINPLSVMNLSNSIGTLGIGMQVLGGSMSVLNAGATIAANAAGTGLSGLIAGTGGWGTAGAATVGTAGSIGSMIGAAMPIIGIGLALASLLGGNSGERFPRTVASGTGVFEGGRWTNTGPDPGWFPNADEFGGSMDRALAQLQKGFALRLDALFDAFEIDAEIGTGVRTRLRRTSGRLVAELFGTINGEEFTTGGPGERLQYGGDGEIAEAWRQFVEDAMTKGIAEAIKASPMADNIKKIFEEELSGDEINAAVDTLISVATLRTRLEGMPAVFSRLSSSIAEVLAMDNYDDFSDAAIALGELQSAIALFYEGFTDPADRFRDAQRALVWEFDQLGVSMPRSIDEFRRLADGLDLTTEEGRDLFKELMGLAPAFLEVARAVEDTFAAISQTTAATIDDFRLDVMTDAQRYAFYDDRIANTLAELENAFDPATIARLYERANDDLRAAWALLTDDEKRRLLPQYIDRAMDLEGRAQERLSVVPDGYASDVLEDQATALAAAVEQGLFSGLTPVAERMEEAAERQVFAARRLAEVLEDLPDRIVLRFGDRSGDLNYA